MAKKESFPSQFSRILSLFQTLPKAPYAHIFIEDLHRDLLVSYGQFDAPRKTLQRDLETLNKILYKGKVEKNPGSGRKSASYRLSSNAQLNLAKQNIVRDEFQSLAIVHSYNFLKPYFPESWQNSLRQQFEQAQSNLTLKNKDVWLSKFGFALDGAFQKYLNPPDGIKELIFQCIHNDNAWIEILYHPENFTKNPRPYTLKPHGVIVRGRKQYLIASKISENSQVQIRTFTMHRILQAKEVSERLSIDIPDLDMQKAIQQYEFEGYYNDDDQPQDIKLSCSIKILSELNFSEIHETQQLYDNGHSQFLLKATMPITWSLVDWFVQKAQYIEVLEPTKLRETVKYRILEMAETYALDVMDDEDLEDENFHDEFTDDIEDQTVIQTLESILADSIDEEDISISKFQKLYKKSIKFIENKEYISTKELKNFLGIGYNLAAKIILKMEQDYVIAPMNQRGKRQVLIEGIHNNGE